MPSPYYRPEHVRIIGAVTTQPGSRTFSGNDFVGADGILRRYYYSGGFNPSLQLASVVFAIPVIYGNYYARFTWQYQCTISGVANPSIPYSGPFDYPQSGNQNVPSPLTFYDQITAFATAAHGSIFSLTWETPQQVAETSSPYTLIKSARSFYGAPFATPDIVTLFPRDSGFANSWAYRSYAFSATIQWAVLDLWATTDTGAPTAISICAGGCITVWLTGTAHSGTAGNWTIKDGGGSTVGSNGTPNGWSVGQNSDGSWTICAPCGASGNYTVTVQVDSGNQAVFPISVIDCKLCGGGGLDPSLPQTGPWLFQATDGRLHMTATQGAGVRYWRSHFGVPVPTWALNSNGVTNNPLDYSPRIVVDAAGTVHMVFSRGTPTSSQIYYCTSWDDGLSWSTPIAVTSSGNNMYGDIGIARQDNTLVRAWINVSGSTGTIKGQIRRAGDATFGSTFTFQGIPLTGGSLANIVTNVDTFHVQQAEEGGARWVLVCTLSGATVPSVWVSADDCATWLQVA